MQLNAFLQTDETYNLNPTKIVGYTSSFIARDANEIGPIFPSL